MRFNLTTAIVVILVIIGVLYYIDNLYKEPILEKAGNSNLNPKKRKTYKEFVEIANLDPKAVIGIPWIKLPELDEYMPSYLKYKEYLLTPVIDQGKCASCWSISVVHMLADRISIYTGGNLEESLSVQKMISCWKGHEGKACSEGGIPELAYNYVIDNGVSLDRDYPYQQAEDVKLTVCNKSTGKRVFVQSGSVRSLCRDPYAYEEGSAKYNSIIKENMMNMKKELLLNGPIVATIQVYQNLYDYDGLSVYTGSNNSEYIGGHAIVIYGFCEEGINGVEPNFDVQYWAVKNSWSLDWPQKSPASKGFFYIKMGSNVCGIESRASRALPVMTDEIKKLMVNSLDESRYTTYDDYVNDPERENYIKSVGKIKGWLK